MIRSIGHEICRKPNFLSKNVDISQNPMTIAEAVIKTANAPSIQVQNAVFIGKPTNNRRLVKVTTTKALNRSFFVDFKKNEPDTVLKDLVIFYDKSPIAREMAKRRWQKLNKDLTEIGANSFRQV